MIDIKQYHYVYKKTFLTDTSKVSHKHYSIYQSNSNRGDRACRGIAVVVNNSVPYSTVNIKTSSHETAARISLNKTIIICSIYFSIFFIDCNKLDELIHQSPKPYNLMGENMPIALYGVVKIAYQY